MDDFADMIDVTMAMRKISNRDLLNTIESRFAAMDARFTTIDDRFVAIDNRFTAIGARFEAIDGRLAVMENVVKEIRDEAKEAKRDMLVIIAENDRRNGIMLEEIRDEVRIAIESIACVDISAQKNHQELSGRVEVLEDGVKQLLGDNQDFFDELRTMRIKTADIDRRVTILES